MSAHLPSPAGPGGSEGGVSIPQQMADHWWWRPGWLPGRRMYTFHITFDGQPAVHQLASGCQEALRGLGGIDLVPPRWLHLTVQGRRVHRRGQRRRRRGDHPGRP